MTTTIGHQLRTAREARSLTIDQAASATRIRLHYLRAMEASEFELLPSPVHARGFLRAYADFLELDAEPLLIELEGKESPPLFNQAPQPSPLQEIDSSPDPKSRGSASMIFIDVGKQLQRQRELLGLSLEDVERHTHLRQRYLNALESGDLEDLPSTVQARGMLNNYATFLGLDSETLLLRFAEGLQASLEARRAIETRTRPIPNYAERPKPARLRRLFSGDVLIGGALALFLIVFMIWGTIRIFTTISTSEPTVTAPSIAEVLLATPTPSETPTLLPPTSTIPAAPQLFPTFPVATGALTDGTAAPQSAGVQVYLTIRQRTWMRVIVDGKVEFEGRVAPGSAYPFAGTSQIEVLSGNGAAIQVFFNGVDFGAMGGFGQISNQIYSLQGVLAPTPTVTQTPTATSRVTITPAPGMATAPALP